MSRPTRLSRVALVAGLALIGMATAANGQPPPQSRVDRILKRPNPAAHAHASNRTAPQKPKGTKATTDAQLRAKVLEIERTQAGYTPPASKRHEIPHP
jgi:hypothetical protein